MIMSGGVVAPSPFLLLNAPFFLYVVFLFMFGVYRHIDGIAKIGWFGIAIYFLSFYLGIVIPIPWMWIGIQIAYFFISMIYVAYKWGDEPLWGKKE
jgi:hypothetical protein